ncbi:hypothetical protein HELRODRAFT_186406 [Helobdella robusta]|uniref:GOST seven transmembrane domain-containing protein n=1 Tax=Helobdella robusta TaxID=6412 RepID=T1FNZ2_HELRO|nr:hypothetical protein HELRODRAFT_186406 [Helobdella robusta]ESO01790.1 hypothetical protein HELRODRAFT_186406 [Helobdella robusta]
MAKFQRFLFVASFLVINASFINGIEVGKDTVSFLQNEYSLTIARTFYKNSTVTIRIKQCHHNVSLFLNINVKKVSCLPNNISSQIEEYQVGKDWNGRLEFKCPHADEDLLTCFPETSVYIITMKFEAITDTLQLEYKGDHGYLSPQDWPLLPFYAVMCVLYSLYAFVWLVLCCCYWKDLLRLQFWIGGVILMGMLEKAMFLGEYDTFSKYGETTGSLLIAAEFISSLKKTVSRMLIIIVSLGFGIIRPRLSTTLNKVTLVGLLFLVCNFAEALCSRIYQKPSFSTSSLVVVTLLVITDAVIMMWIFTNLVKTIRLVTLKKNIVKLTLYRHFRNVLIFSILVSVVFVVWSTIRHRSKDCVSDWSEQWWEVAFWHLLFCIILLAIIILWRPAANNQRYAYSPLYDGEDEEDGACDDDGNEGFGVKKLKRSHSEKTGKEDDDLKWVEENIPSSMIDNVLTNLIESEEEINQNRVEMNKML